MSDRPSQPDRTGDAGERSERGRTARSEPAPRGGSLISARAAAGAVIPRADRGLLSKIVGTVVVICAATVAIAMLPVTMLHRRALVDGRANAIELLSERLAPAVEQSLAVERVPGPDVLGRRIELPRTGIEVALVVFDVDAGLIAHGDSRAGDDAAATGAGAPLTEHAREAVRTGRSEVLAYAARWLDEHGERRADVQGGLFRTYERSGSLHHVRPLGPVDRPVAYLYLSYPLSEVNQKLAAHVAVALVAGLILLFVVGLPAIWHLNGLILRPISRLVLANRAAAAGRDDAAFVPREQIPDDEIGMVMRSWNQLYTQILEARQKLRERAEKLADQNRLLEVTNKELAAREEELRSWGTELEARILEKSAELFDLQARLHRSERLGAVGQLAAGVAHEIRNPLASIAGYAEDVRELLAELELEDANAEDVASALKVIEEQAYRCKVITGKLLDFARTDYRLEPVDVAELAGETIAVVTHKAKRRGVKIVGELGEGAPPAQADRSHLQQVIMNLLDNAIDAVPDQDGVVTVTSGLLPGSDDRVHVSITDNGPGIPDKDQSNIFDTFFTTKSKGAGTGLGLAIAKSVVRRLGGKITLKSQLHVGTTFTVELPVADEAQIAAADTSLALTAPSEESLEVSVPEAVERETVEPAEPVTPVGAAARRVPSPSSPSARAIEVSLEDDAGRDAEPLVVAAEPASPPAGVNAIAVAESDRAERPAAPAPREAAAPDDDEEEAPSDDGATEVLGARAAGSESTK